MTDVDQLSFGFAPQSPPAPPKATSSKAAPAKAVTSKAASAAPQPSELPPTGAWHEMAQTLDAHPDYKVLRRLPLRDDWGAADACARTQRVVFLDTETTGLDARTERIIELAMLAVQVDAATGLPTGPVEIFEGFEDPGKPISAAITEITGITDAMVQGHRLDDARIAAFVANADLIVAHNAGFDRPFVENRLPVFADAAWACSFAGIDWKSQGSGSAKLEFLAHERGWFYDAHRALVDCHALLAVLAAPLARAPGNGLLALLMAAGQSRHVLRATGAPFEAKDSLKARGYRWDTEARVWWTSVPNDAAMEAEKNWLFVRVYGSRQARVQVETQTARVQFSRRAGNVQEVLLSA